MIGVDLVPGQDVKGAVVGATQEDTAAGIVSGKKKFISAQTKILTF